MLCSRVCSHLSSDKSRKMAAAAASKEPAQPLSEEERKREYHKLKFPGLCKPDNPDHARQLLQPLEEDTAVAKQALTEVIVCLCVWWRGEERSIIHCFEV